MDLVVILESILLSEGIGAVSIWIALKLVGNRLRNYIYDSNPIPNKIILRTQTLLPKLLSDKKARVERKIQKLQDYLKVIEEQGISDANQLSAILLQKKKGRKT